MHVLVFTTCLPVSWFNLFTFCPVYPQSWSTCSLWRTILSRCLPSSTRRLRAKAFTSSAIGSVFRKCTVSATPSAVVTRPSHRQRCHPNRDNWWELDHCRQCCAHTRCTHFLSVSFSPSLHVDAMFFILLRVTINHNGSGIIFPVESDYCLY